MKLGKEVRTTMNINKFTQKSLEAVQNCEKIAAIWQSGGLAQEHLLYAVADTG